MVADGPECWQGPGMAGIGRMPRPQTRELRFNPVSLDLVVERLATDPEALGGLEFVAAGLLEHLNDCVSLNALKQSEVGVTAAFPGAGSGVGHGEIGRIDHGPLAEQHGSLNFVLQLSYVPGPVERRQLVDRRGGEPGNRAICLGGKPV